MKDKYNKEVKPGDFIKVWGGTSLWKLYHVYGDRKYHLVDGWRVDDDDTSGINGVISILDSSTDVEIVGNLMYSLTRDYEI